MSDPQPTRRQEPVHATPTTDGPAPRPPLVRVDATRAGGDGSRTSPRMRFDVLQLVAWGVGLYLLVAGLVAVARTGFEDVGLFEPLVEVNGFPATPLLAVLQIAVGVALLVAATGEVKDRGLRVWGVLLGVVGAVWVVEPGAFEPYLGVVEDSGVALLAMGVLLTAASFLPPLSVARPGVGTGE